MTLVSGIHDLDAMGQIKALGLLIVDIGKIAQRVFRINWRRCAFLMTHQTLERVLSGLVQHIDTFPPQRIQEGGRPESDRGRSSGLDVDVASDIGCGPELTQRLSDGASLFLKITSLLPCVGVMNSHTMAVFINDLKRQPIDGFYQLQINGDISI